MDSIAGSIGAAELFGGFAARASEVNSETRFCLDYWNVQAPEPIEKMLTVHPDAGVCLVDHQQTSQLNSCIPVERIVGVIDHHALQNSTIVTDMPIYIDIRPWGSMSTIIAHNFMMYRRRPTRPVAGMLLCAILSDTLNLQGPTTTEWDRLMATVLTDIAGVKDVQLLASQQFKAKSAELETLTANALVTGDQKIFTFKTDCFDGSMAFAVVETTDDEVILKRSVEIVTGKREEDSACCFHCRCCMQYRIRQLYLHSRCCMQSLRMHNIPPDISPFFLSIPHLLLYGSNGRGQACKRHFHDICGRCQHCTAPNSFAATI